jgi:KUP system potassium uptake protein
MKTTDAHTPSAATQANADSAIEFSTHEPKQSAAALALLALGVVYGDIGTSPLYAAKETFNPQHGIALTTANILGGVSAIFWALMIIVTLKYVLLVLRASNRGEGGIMALLALATAAVGERRRLRTLLLTIGVFGAALFYGDAVLTPAISVLSAVEGLEVGTNAFKPYIVPIAIGILVALFLIQRHGTGFVGLLFGPVCVLWFAALAASGIWNILKKPEILAAMNPAHALQFISGHGFGSFLVLGSVLLAVTGAEALYADMGHFGKRPIRLAWFGLVAPSLVLNYFGQGALLIGNPKALENPFFLAFPDWALYPMVALATAATVIASQATISGAYSMTQQAIKLGYLPRMQVLHTSSKAMGQIYVPTVNWVLLAAVVLAVIGFGSSSRLASAYGVSVMGTMLATTFLTFFVVRFSWHFPLWLCITVTGFFMRQGRVVLLARLQESSIPLRPFLDSLFRSPPHRVPGTAIFLNSALDATPHALLHSLKHYNVLHEQNVFMTLQFLDVPWVKFEDRVQCDKLGHNCWRVLVQYGFMNRPDVYSAIELCGPRGLQLDPEQVSYFLSREKIVPSVREESKLGYLRQLIFSAMARNAGSATDFFNIPANRVVELGTRIQL